MTGKCQRAAGRSQFFCLDHVASSMETSFNCLGYRRTAQPRPTSLRSNTTPAIFGSSALTIKSSKQCTAYGLTTNMQYEACTNHKVPLPRAQVMTWVHR